MSRIEHEIALTSQCIRDVCVSMCVFVLFVDAMAFYIFMIIITIIPCVCVNLWIWCEFRRVLDCAETLLLYHIDIA